MSEVLTQSQIDALLGSMLNNEGEPSTESMETPPATEKKYKKYDFYSPKKFTRDKLKLLKGIYENYSRVVSSRVNSILRTGCQVEIVDVEEQRYYEFANSLNDNDVLTIINVATQEGPAKEPVVMKIDTLAMLCMIDHMLGSTGEDMDEIPNYTYTDIELRLYQSIVKYMVDVMADGWTNYLELQFDLDRVETNPTMMQEISRDESVAIVILEIQIGNVQGKINICLPDSALSGVFGIMDERSAKDGLTEEEREITSKIIFDNIKKTSLEIKAELGKSNLLLRDVYNLQVGDVINLNKSKDSEVYLNIAEKTWFKGYLGTNNKNMAVKISDVL